MGNPLVSTMVTSFAYATGLFREYPALYKLANNGTERPAFEPREAVIVLSVFCNAVDKVNQFFVFCEEVGIYPPPLLFSMIRN